MKSFRLSGPSPAMVVACVALSLALAGSAVAGTEVLNKAVTKSKVKKIAKKQANKQIDRRAPGLSVANATDATNLGGAPAGDYQRKADFLFATVAPANANPQIVRGRGATAVTQVVPGSYRVTFNRDITGCTWLATYGPPDDQFVDSRFATVRGRDTATDVGVVLRDDAGAMATGSGFHVQAICP